MLSSVSSVKDTLYGTLAATTNVTFATPPSGDIAQTLNGTLVLNLANGKLMKLDLLNELSKIGKFGGAQPAKGYTSISQMSGTFNLHNGVAQTNDLESRAGRRQHGGNRHHQPGQPGPEHARHRRAE